MLVRLEGCPFTFINCPLSYAGCEVTLPRKDVPAHISESTVSHTLMQTSIQLVLCKENECLRQELHDKTAQIDHLQHERQRDSKRIEKLEAQVKELVHHQKVTKTTAQLLGPVELTMHNFEKLKNNQSTWFSPSFYSHPQGYKMCLGIAPYGWGSGKGTHVSLGIYVKSGDHDEELVWPFRASAMIKLLCQDGDHKHYTRKIKLNISKSSGRQGVHFISHAELQPKYLKSDCLKFQFAHLKFKK